MIDEPQILLCLSAILFSLGLMGVCIRRNPLIMFMCIELMLNAANLAFASFSRYSSVISETAVANLQAGVTPGAHPVGAASSFGGSPDGIIFVFIVMTIAAAEAVVGLAIIIAIFRSRSDVDADELAAMKG